MIMRDEAPFCGSKLVVFPAGAPCAFYRVLLCVGLQFGLGGGDGVDTQRVSQLDQVQQHIGHLGADGWAFAHESCTDEETGASIPDEDDWQGICAVDRRGKQQVLHGFAGAYLLEYGHGQTLLLEGGGLWAIEGGAALKLTRIGEGQPELLASGVDNATVDGAGHMLVAAGGKMHIGGAEGWSTIVLPKETPKPDITPANAAP